MTGEIAWLGDLTKLTTVYLWGNELSGPIPELSGLTELIYLSLSQNTLTGEVPDVSGLTKLQDLYLWGNELSGPIPDLSSLPALKNLSLSDNLLMGRIPASLGALTTLELTRFANNGLTGCVPHGLRFLLAAVGPAAGIPAQDFIAFDANGDGDTDDEGDVPGLNLPFCMLSELTFSDATLNPAFAPGTVAYTATSTGASTTVTATLNDSSDSLSITKGATSYISGDAAPLEIGSNLFTIEVTPSDTGLLKQTYIVDVLHGSVQSDRAALIALYNSAGGENWTTSTNWGTAEPISSWFGVTADSNDHVTRLELIRNNLAGTLPDELGSLTNLRELRLSNNQLSGTIPDLSGLTSLTRLELSYNELSGTISDLGGLTSLQYMNLRNNELSGTIPDLSGLTDLRELTLIKNEFTGDIPNLSGLTNLTRLELEDNLLSGKIPDLSDLTNLKYLYLSRNGLTGAIPGSLNSLTKLEALYLPGNQLRETIPDLSSLTAMKYLDLGGNMLTGDIPDLSALTNLEDLYLQDNQLRGTIPNLNTFFNMQYLDLSQNLLEGAIPDLNSLGVLKGLYLHQNQLTEKIPPSLSYLTNLRELFLWGNQLSGPIPNLSRLTSLQYLFLQDNQLSGMIPDLSPLTELRRVFLEQNQLEGEIPYLSDLTKLQDLYLRGNLLEGEIPYLGGLTNLQRLDLQDNKLSGEIPPSLGSLVRLRVLSLQDNQLTGQIPDLANLQTLFFLELSANQLSGEIPPSLGSLGALRVLYLQDNDLTGEIPAELGNLTELKTTRFANNALTGCVPHGLRFLLDVDEFLLGVRPQDFIAVDANGDGDTDDEGDVPGLNLPFCMLSALTLSDATLDPAFAPNTATYTAESTVASTMVTATLNDDTDVLSITKGATSYNSGDAVPFEAGSNLITIEVTPSVARLLTQTYTVEVFHPGSELTDKEALIALYNSTGGSGWTSNLNWNSALDLDMWYGVDGVDGRVVWLELPGNNLRGTVPAQLATLTELRYLDLRDNQLRGAIPPELGDLNSQGLVFLDLSANQLTGTIPAELGDLRSLNVLHLNDNRLTGAIPAELGELRSLTDLFLRNNRLNGAIPAELGHLSTLKALYLNDNQLSGTIPPELSDLSSLTQLSLRNNKLSGTIPASLGNLFGLDFARFANNAFTGCVPHGLRYLLNQPEFETDVPAHDFALDANGDGDTADPGDIAGLALPFCGLSDLTLGGLTLEPAFTSGVEVYTAAAAHAVTSTTVTANLNHNADGVSITKGADTYTSVDPVPLDVGPNLITIEVTASDGSTAPHTYRVTVTRAHNTPPVFDEGRAATRGVDENTAAGQPIGDPLSATDADSADTLTYSLDTASDAFFDIKSTTGQLRTKVELDHETTESYSVEVSVSDGKDANGDADPSADDTIAVTVLISDVTEGASFALANDTRTIAENTPAGVTLGAPFTATDGDGDILTYSLGANNLGANNVEYFEIDAASGQLWTRAALDYETKFTYSVGVTATSGAFNNVILVTVTVENVEEPGVVTLSPVQPRIRETLFADLSDPDVVSGVATWAWERSTSRTSSWTTIDGAASASYRTDDADADHYLRATASYDDGEDAGKSASVVSANPVRALAPGNNDPSFTPAPVARTVDENELAGTSVGAPDTRTVDENELPGTIVGAPFVATDDDKDTLTYFLSGTDAAAFEIDSSSGQLRTRTVLDFETQQSYLVDVTATDPSGGFGEVTVTITVGNVQEPGTVRLSLLEPVVGARLTATLVDPDEVSGSVTWLWESSPDRASWTPASGATSAANYTPVAADVGAYLRATASYGDGADANRSAEAVSAHPVREPRGGRTPVFTDGASTTRHTTKTAPPGCEHRSAGGGHRRRQRPPELHPGRGGHDLLRHR